MTSCWVVCVSYAIYINTYEFLLVLFTGTMTICDESVFFHFGHSFCECTHTVHVHNMIYTILHYFALVSKFAKKNGKNSRHSDFFIKVYRIISNIDDSAWSIEFIRVNTIILQTIEYTRFIPLSSLWIRNKVFVYTSDIYQYSHKITLNEQIEAKYRDMSHKSVNRVHEKTVAALRDTSKSTMWYSWFTITSIPR